MYQRHGCVSSFSNVFFTYKLPNIVYLVATIHLSLANTNILTTTAGTRALSTRTNTSSAITGTRARCRGNPQLSQTT
jgi:hypothetical protein